MAIPTIDFLTRNLRHGVNRRTGIFGFLGGLAGIAGVSSVEATIAKPPVDCRSTGMQCLTGAECCSGRCITKSDGTARCARKTSNRKKKHGGKNGGSTPVPPPPPGPTCTVCADGCPHITIESAIAAAADGDTITIGPGTYDPTPAPGNYIGVIQINKNLTLQACDLTDPPTIINTQSSGQLTLFFLGVLDNLDRCIDTSIMVWLKNLVIEGDPTSGRGAMWSECNASIGVMDCTISNFGPMFTGPYANAPITHFGLGYANFYTTTISNCVGHTTGSMGSAVYTSREQNTGSNHTMTLSGCTITGCTGPGPAVRVGQYSTLTLDGNTTIHTNTSTGTNGGGVAIGGADSQLIFLDSASVSSNSCLFLGGGVYAGADATVTGANVNNIQNNTASSCANFYDAGESSSCVLS